MKSFAERNPYIIGAVGVAATLAVTVAALNYKSLPFINENAEYSAYFADASGLIPGAAVQVSGAKVGQVESLSLDGPRVQIKFNLDTGIHLGDHTEAAIKTKTLLGAKVLEVTPRGGGQQNTTIPLERTTSAYQLPDAIGDLSAAISGLNTDQLATTLSTLSDTFKDTPPTLKVAVDGVARFSDILTRRDDQLRALLSNANTVSSVLAQRSDQVVSLIVDTNALLVQLQTQSSALDQISANLSALARQIKGFIAENDQTFKPALDKLNGALTLVDNRKDKIQETLRKLNPFLMSLGESVGSGPFFKAYLVNLLPGQFVQPFVDVAFSDLGLDPNTLTPAQRTDPQTGQPGTPPLPVPYPRTGQGGQPHLTLPDAITGKPGDPRYPFREPLPAPPPGGPPPGPPAIDDSNGGAYPSPAPPPPLGVPTTAGQGQP